MKKQFGFSLAEMMVVMLMIAIVLAATAPMITRKVSRERSDKIFDMLNVDPTNAVEYIKGRNQRIFMNAKKNGYVGIVEPGKKIPDNSVILGYNTAHDARPHHAPVKATNYTAIGFDNISENDSIVIGNNAKSARYSVAIGNNSEAGTITDSTSTSHSTSKKKKGSAVAIGYNASAVSYGISIGAKSHAAYSAVAIGHNAKAEHPNTIVLGTEDDTVYIPGNLVVDHAALIGRAGRRNDNLYFRPYAQEDGRHFAVLNAGDWKGEDSNITMVLDESILGRTGEIGVSVGPYSTNRESWRGDYRDNNRTHIHFTDPTKGNDPKSHKYSDLRLKNIGEEFTLGLDGLNKLKFYNFTFKNDKNKTPHVGVIAQDLQKVFPNAVTKDDKGFLLIRWDEMFYSALNAIKELNTQIIAITENIQTITKDITDLKALTEKQQTVIDAQAKTITEQQEELQSLAARIEKLERKKLKK